MLKKVICIVLSTILLVGCTSNSENKNYDSEFLTSLSKGLDKRQKDNDKYPEESAKNYKLWVNDELDEVKDYKKIGRSSLELLGVKDSDEKESINRSDKKMPDSEDTTETSTPTEKVDLDNYYNSVQATIDEMNNKTGDTLSMGRTSVTPGIKINLSPLIASYSVSEQRAIVGALNETFYNIARNNGVNSPKFYYYINNEEIAVNRYIMDPSSVKFKGILKDQYKLFIT